MPISSTFNSDRKGYPFLNELIENHPSVIITEMNGKDLSCTNKWEKLAIKTY